MNETAEKLQFQILKMLSSVNSPQGAGAISDALKDTGFSISEAAVGRTLRGMRNEGLLARVGFQGHLITNEGQERMRELDAQIRISDMLRVCLSGGEERGKSHLCDALLALRSLGRETVLETINRATDADLSRIEETIKKYAVSPGDELQEGLFSEFYQSLLAISKIPMFEHFFNLLAASVVGDPYLAKVFRKAERALGGTYEKILDAIRARQPEVAAGMVGKQIDQVISHIMADADDR